MFLSILKGNKCHLPAGSPNSTGGQFCSSGASDSLYGSTGIYGGKYGITPRSKGGMYVAQEFLAVDTSTPYGSILQMQLFSIEKEVKERGYPLDKVHILKGLSYFEVGGKRHTQAGLAYTSSSYLRKRGEIEIYPDAFVDPATGDFGISSGWKIAAHEITHHKFEAVLTQYGLQMEKLASDPNLHREYDTVSFDVDLPQNSEYIKKNYPLVRDFRKAYVNKSWGRFVKEDGITEYSRDWWASYNSGVGTTRQVLHETLAEYATLTPFSTPKRSVWTELSRLVDNYSKKSGFMDPYFADVKQPPIGV